MTRPAPLLLTIFLPAAILVAETPPVETPDKHPQPPQVEAVAPLGFIPHLEQKLGRRLEPSEKPAVAKALRAYHESCRTAHIKFSGAALDALDLPKPKAGLRPVRPALTLHPGADPESFQQHIVPRLEALLGRKLKGSEESRVKRAFAAYQSDIARARQSLATDLTSATGLQADQATTLASDSMLKPGAGKHL